MTSDGKADEPDMDEILTSIRRIISDGDFPEAEQGQAVARTEDSRPAGPQGDDVLHLTDKIEEERSYGAQPASSNQPSASEETFVSELESMVPQGDSGANQPDPVSRSLTGDAPNIAESLEAIANLIGAKETSGAAVPGDAKTREMRFLEDLAAETLRREIKAWLDANLPGLVERLVREEIENLLRLAGNRR